MKKLQKGGPVSQSAPKNWMVNYMDSDIYKSRLKRIGMKPIEDQQRQDLLNTNILSYEEEDSRAFNKEFSDFLIKNPNQWGTDIPMYLKKGVPNININPDVVKEINESYKHFDKNLVGWDIVPEQMTAHELSHIQRELGTGEQAIIKALNKKNIKSNVHDTTPNEQKADLDALRFLMHKEGVYDTSKRDMTIEDYNKAKSNKKISNSFIFKRLNKFFTPEKLVNFNNIIASSNTNQNLNTVKNGGSISTEGYKRNSPDKNNPYNIIPSNQITMQDVDYPVFGVDDLGNEQIMYPGQDYTYPGNYVTEYPMKKKINKKQFGGQEEDPYNFGAQSTPFYDYGNTVQFMEGNIKPKSTDTQPNKPAMKIKDWLEVSRKAMPRMTSNLMNQFVDPGSLYNVLGYAEAGVNAFGNNSRQKKQEEWLRSQTNTDNLFPVSQENDRGEYNMNGSAYGMFRPDQLGAQSPYGMTQGQYFQKGGQTTPISYGAYNQVTPYGTIGRKQMTTEEKDYVIKHTGMKDNQFNHNLPIIDKYLKEYNNPVKPVGSPAIDINNKFTMNENGTTNAGVYNHKTGGWGFAKYEYGGQSGFGLDLNGRHIAKNTKDKGDISKTLKPVDEDEATIEAELGETIFGDFDGDGINEHMKIGGKKHYAGGTPLNAPPASFVFSDTKKLKIGGEILVEFGKPEDTKKKYTPAELAKKYDINKFKTIIDDKDADPIKKRTAELMIDNYNKKLGKLALVQEDMKGFPNGIPEVAIPYLMTQVGPEEMGEMEQGGTQGEFARGGQYDPWDDLIDPYKGGKTKEGTITPTGKSNPYNRSNDYLNTWESIIPGISKLDNAQAQSLIYDYTLKNNPAAVSGMWSQYGNTAKGLRTNSTKGIGKNGKFSQADLTPENLNILKDAYVDGYFGVRQLDPTKNVGRLEGSPIPVKAFSPAPLNPITGEPEYTEETIPNQFTSKVGTQAPTDFWTQDKINTFAALGNRANLKKYLPWAPPITGVTADPTFYDPNRELAANAEMANTEMMYANQFSGPQSTGARNSAVSGASATNAANIMGRYNNQNVGVANQFEGMNAEFTNNLLAAQGNRAKQLFDGTVVANQQYDNSRAQANDVIRRNVVGALDNRQKTQWINSWYPQFDLDPSSGYINFAPGTGHTGVTPGGSAPMSYLDTYKKLKQANPDVPDEVLREQAKQMTGQARNTVTSDGDVRSTYQGPTPQQLQQLIKFQGG